jgi:hypothetical protein
MNPCDNLQLQICRRLKLATNIHLVQRLIINTIKTSHKFMASTRIKYLYITWNMKFRWRPRVKAFIPLERGSIMLLEVTFSFTFQPILSRVHFGSKSEYAQIGDTVTVVCSLIENGDERVGNARLQSDRSTPLDWSERQMDALGNGTITERHTACLLCSYAISVALRSKFQILLCKVT